MKRMPYLLAATGLTLALATVSCTTIGTHVKGGFACKAPQGTCAPMSTIDAQAIAGLGGSGGQTVPVSSPSADTDARFINTGDEGVPVRTGEHVLRVVFPAHTDGGGVYHEEAVAHVVSEHSGWVLRPAEVPASGSLDAAIQASAPSSNPGTPTPVATTANAGPTIRGVPLNLREAAAGLAAPADPMPDPQEQVAVDMGGPDSGMPTPAALAAARAGHHIGDAATTTRVTRSRVQHVAARRRHHRVAPQLAHARPADNPTTALNRTALGRLSAARPQVPDAPDATHAAKELASVAPPHAQDSRP